MILNNQNNNSEIKDLSSNQMRNLGKYSENVRKSVPLVHCITNYVTVNDVANILLACGASPIMSDEPKDAVDIAAICDGLYINIGTLNERSIKAMFEAGKIAKELGKLILLDPVGAGATTLRTETARRIVYELQPNIIRGNASEIKSLALGFGTTKGVDVDANDGIDNENLDESIKFIKEFSKKTNAVIIVTGKTDLVTDGEKCYVIHNGHKEMSKVTGTGCMLSAIITAYAAANKDNIMDNIVEAAAEAVCSMGIAGEIAYSMQKGTDGNIALRGKIIDCIYNINKAVFEKGADYEIR